MGVHMGLSIRDWIGRRAHVDSCIAAAFQYTRMNATACGKRNCLFAWNRVMLLASRLGHWVAEEGLISWAGKGRQRLRQQDWERQWCEDLGISRCAHCDLVFLLFLPFAFMLLFFFSCSSIFYCHGCFPGVFLFAVVINLLFALISALGSPFFPSPCSVNDRCSSFPL
ncbi:hypothetical protein J3F83DRAFT_35228 [Trichoderma novae-zelandiae]